MGSDFTAKDKAAIGCLLTAIVLKLALLGAAVYVVIHFVRKWW